MAALLAPATFVIFVLARIATAGPFVDGIHLNSTYGLIAFVLGRGLDGVLTLAPMLLGALLGAARARRLSDAPPIRHGWSRIGLWTRRFGTAVQSPAGPVTASPTSAKAATRARS